MWPLLTILFLICKQKRQIYGASPLEVPVLVVPISTRWCLTHLAKALNLSPLPSQKRVTQELCIFNCNNTCYLIHQTALRYWLLIIRDLTPVLHTLHSKITIPASLYSTLFLTLCRGTVRLKRLAQLKSHLFELDGNLSIELNAQLWKTEDKRLNPVHSAWIFFFFFFEDEKSFYNSQPISFHCG